MVKLFGQFVFRLLGLSCCGEWTQWEIKEEQWERPCRPGDGVPFINGQLTITYTKKWQERRCTLCGKVQQKRLEY